MNSYAVDYCQVLPAPLLHAFLDDFESLRPFYAYDPRDPDVWPRAIEAVRSRTTPPPRKVLSRILEEQNTRYGADETVLDNARSLAVDDTYVVSTGQQTGLFTGPLYTIYKAVTAVRLARRVSEETGVRAVPVFWMAADDHDYAEINHVHVCRADGEALRFELSPDDPNDRRSASDRELGPGIGPLLGRFEEALPDSEYSPSAIDALRQHCTAEITLSDAFARLMTLLFRGQGLVLVDPTDPALKFHMSPVFEREIRDPLASTRSVLAVSGKLAEAGFQPQVSRSPDAVNLFLYQDGQRNALRYENERFSNRDRSLSFTEKDLLELLDEAPERFTHNVITRPLVQDTLFPTLTYIGGPAEIAYYGQLGGVYRQYGLPFPVVYPRASHTLVGARTARVLEKHGLALSHFVQGIESVVDRKLRDDMPVHITEGLRAARGDVKAHYRNLKGHMTTIDPGLIRIVEASERKTNFALGRLEEKTLRALKKADGVMRSQIIRADRQLYPNGQLQERIANIWQYVALHGFDVMRTLFEATDETDFRHRITLL
ncbi:MAG: bacillithiol biosynthesis cysteine-adding enzyme BshC [Gemmatimonadetes bacterium]|nr:bacillithiol biosynthesis cysteine-adding enzyme BshC [Gemmatimonadota bacterium]